MKESDPGAFAAVQSVRGKLNEWGISHTFLAGQLDVSRQYVWQILNQPGVLSPGKARMIEDVVDQIIARQMHLRTLGDRLRAARRSAGLTLKEVAARIGYSWVVVQRWEKNVALPGLEVLLRLCSVYRISFEIVRTVRPRQSVARQWQQGATLVPVATGDDLPSARPSQRRPLQRMVIRISTGDVAAAKGRSLRR